MSAIRLRQEVEKALQVEWPYFRKRHPRMAAVLDQHLLVEQVVQSLDEDEAYHQAMADAAAEGILAEMLGGIVLQFVQKWLRQLL